VEIPPLNSRKCALGRNSSPIGNHWYKLIFCSEATFEVRLATQRLKRRRLIDIETFD